MGSGSAQKLFERMKNTPFGWGEEDFEILLTGFGFVGRQGGKHTIYWHPKYTNLCISVPRHKQLKPWVARDSIKLLNELSTLEENKKDGTTNQGS